MSVRLADPINLVTAAERAERVDERVSLAQLPRLVEALRGLGERADEAQQIDCRLELTGDAQGVRVRGRVGTRLRLTCQRCLERFEESVDLPIDWRSGELPEGDFELTDEPVSLLEWVEDEVLLALPAIPRHGDRRDCGRIAADYLVASDEAPKRTPFADLKKMLEERRD